MENSTKYKVAVKCCTYNQAQYITDALNGFVMQETDFPFVCCIIDDASTDGEQEVIRKYVAENFDLSEPDVAYEKETDDAYITYARHKSNKNCFFAVLYLKKNLFHENEKKLGLISEWMDNAEYIALCEGDDYWIDARKLQMQYDYMVAHLDFSLVRTDVNRRMPNGAIELDIFKTYQVEKIKDSFEDYVINAWWVAPCTWMYKGKSFVRRQMPADCFYGDISLLLQLCEDGKVFFLDKTTSTYRVLDNSASHFKNPWDNVQFLHKVANTRCYFLKGRSLQLRWRLFVKLVKETKLMLINRQFYFSKIIVFVDYIWTYFVKLFIA